MRHEVAPDEWPVASHHCPDQCPGRFSTRASAPGNVACESRRVKPKGRLSHPGQPGEGQTGRVNANEPPYEAALRKVVATDG